MLATGIIGVYFLFKSLTTLAAQSNINLFKTAGLLYFIGIITSIIFIGALVIFVGWILHIVAYFTIQPDKETAAA